MYLRTQNASVINFVCYIISHNSLECIFTYDVQLLGLNFFVNLDDLHKRRAWNTNKTYFVMQYFKMKNNT